MNGYREHVTFEVLNDFVDGRLRPEHRNAVEHHLASCHHCGTEHDALQRVLAAAAAMPRDVLPDHDIWPELRSALAARKLASIQRHAPAVGMGASSSHEHRSMLRRRWWLAAAALVLIVLSSGITAAVLRYKDGRASVADGRQKDAPDVSGARAVAVPASFRTTESEYLRTFAELRETLDAQRHRLRPQTVATVERSLAVVDSAIAEGRAALLADPNNTALLDLLSSSYQHKLDLLRRASELGSRT